VSARPVTRGASKTLEITEQDVQPIVAPKGAPPRFSIARLGEATDFGSWADVARLMAPLYRKAEALPAAGPLHDELEKIRASSNDPKIRAQKALELVQDRVRYVALEMGQGGYVPADAEATWSRRFGDCKAKTALLLGLLHSLGIESEPLLVQSSFGDAIGERLPLLSYFDHVLVRAHIGARTYYLDGTRSGDSDLDQILVPDFGWTLPVVDNAQLVQLTPPPLDKPQLESKIVIDAKAGVYTPATVSIDQLVRGDLAVAINAGLGALSDAQREQYFAAYWKKMVDDLAPGVTTSTFDKTTRQLRLAVQGKLKLDWSDGFFHVPMTTIGDKPDLDRVDGPDHDAPISVSYPAFIRTETKLLLPQGFFPADVSKLVPHPVHTTLMGVEYSRTQSATRDSMTVDTSTRSITSEVPYKEALAAVPALKTLTNGEVSVRLPASYRATAADVPELKSDAGGSASDFITRGNTLLNSGHFDEAIADFSKAIEQEPNNVTALADRGVAYAWKHDNNKATTDLNAAAAIDPANAVMLRGKGLQAELQRNFSQAADFYTRSLATEPNNRFALFHRADALLMQAKYPDALRDLDAILVATPSDADALAVRAFVEASQGKTAEAAKDIAAAKASNPGSTAITAAELQLARRKGDGKALVEIADKLIAAAPTSGDGYVERARGNFALGHLNEALGDTDRALKLGANPTDLRVLRANILKQKGDDAGVLKEAEAMVREHPDSDYAWVAAAKTYASLGRKADAFKAYDKALSIKPAGYIYINRAQTRPLADEAGRASDYDAALKMDPDDSDALIGKAEILTRQGKFAEAADLYLKAEQRSGDAGKYLEVDRATLLYRAGRAAEAQKLFAAARSSATDAEALNNLCWAKATAGILLESALEDCRAALKLEPGDNSYLDSLGMVLLKLGKLDEALNAYNRALANKPLASSLMGRAFVYARMGDKAHAQADLSAARKLNPDINEIFDQQYGLKF
jgi:tetratricopeptide (TPR) repeat protein